MENTRSKTLIKNWPNYVFGPGGEQKRVKG